MVRLSVKRRKKWKEGQISTSCQCFLLVSWCMAGSSWQLLPPPSCPGIVRFNVLRYQLLVFTNPRLESSKDLLAVTMPKLCPDQYSYNLRRWDLAIGSLYAFRIETQCPRAGSTHSQDASSPPPVQTSPINHSSLLRVGCTCSNSARQKTFSNQSASVRS